MPRRFAWPLRKDFVEVDNLLGTYEVQMRAHILLTMNIIR